jgi:DNA-binding winged helix-turn-helix (wHTH) protein
VSTKVETQNVIEGPFHLGAWLVEPRLNRLTRDGESIQIELKMMDVLVCLAEHAGELVERQTLIDTVWATEFISENILTRAIAELRNVLGDDAKNPSFIETIHRRGYTLVAPVETAASDEAVTAKVARFPIPEGRVEDERGPYPGLAAFTEDDAEFFFGRETEVTQLWRKLTTRRLLAVIGPSGVGKSSLLHAGLIPSAPNGWGALICQPGEAPFAALARSLAPQFEGDPEAISKLVDVSDENTALALLSRWRQLHEQALLIIDQFEELFTQCPAEVQAQFADLLGRIAREADIHVLLSMRDDFHYRCHEHPALAPVFDSIVPISAPARADLRRALIEPATRFGFSFEEEGIVEDMLDAVEGERGALPLLAFSIARLWDERDSTRRLLTKETCDAIGGVQGALARHAERTLSTIGAARLPTVREIFRNRPRTAIPAAA